MPSLVPPSFVALAWTILAGVGAGPAARSAAAIGLSPDTVPEAPAAAPMVQPGAPGESTRSMDADEMSGLGGVAYTEADVGFMRGMIWHHAQALEMTALVSERATTDAVRSMALRMEISQADEIGLMARWLRDRDRSVPEWRAAVAAGTARRMIEERGRTMPGMLTPEQMEELRSAAGVDFDRRFLELMIHHHEGAIVMVRNLFASDGAGQEAEIFRFASHVDADQSAEIARMRQVLEGLR